MRVSRLDLLLLLMVIIWGSNFSAIKFALRDFPEITFNAMRLTLSSAVLLIVIAVQSRRPAPAQAAHPTPSSTSLQQAPPSHPSHLSSADWRRVCLLAVVGTLLYQLLFLAGVARTSVANSSLILGCTPVVVALMVSAMGHERLTAVGWIGAVLSFAGMYAIVGRRTTLSAATVTGDALVFAAMLCWSLYSVVAAPLLKRHSPLVITGWSMAIGTAFYLVIAIPSLMTTEWRFISPISWLLMAASSLLALAFAYMVWYTAVQKIGSARTAAYSNLTPVVAMAVAALWLGERISGLQVFGAALILGGIAVARLQATG